MISRLNILILLGIVLTGLIIGLVFTTYNKPQKADFMMVEKGRLVPSFTFKTLAGSDHQLHDFKGKPVFIHFWATWCAPCVVEFPELVTFAKDNKNIEVLAISSDSDVKTIHRFLEEHASDRPDNFKIIHDPESHLTRDRFSIFRLPETLVLDSSLILREHVVGAYADWETYPLGTISP